MFVAIGFKPAVAHCVRSCHINLNDERWPDIPVRLVSKRTAKPLCVTTGEERDDATCRLVQLVLNQEELNRSGVHILLNLSRWLSQCPPAPRSPQPALSTTTPTPPVINAGQSVNFSGNVSGKTPKTIPGPLRAGSPATFDPAVGQRQLCDGR